MLITSYILILGLEEKGDGIIKKMKAPHIFRNKVVNKMTTKLGFTRKDAIILFDIYFEALVEAWREHPWIRIPKFGTFKYEKNDHNGIKISFKPHDYLHILLNNKDWSKFSAAKYGNGKKKDG